MRKVLLLEENKEILVIAELEMLVARCA